MRVLLMTAMLASAPVQEVPEAIVGELAPPHGLRSWLGAKGGALADSKGKVVILHTFAWNCSSCLRKGIPLSVDLLAANAERGLEVLSITTPAMPDETKRVIHEAGMQQPVALANPGGMTSPYVSLENPFTYMFVIGRNGELVWRGDPSTKEEEFLEALQGALSDPGGRVLDRELNPALAAAAGLYATGEADAARQVAEKLQRKFARKKGDEAQALAADAAWLVARVEARRVELTNALDAALDAEDALASLELMDALERGFPKGKEPKEASARIDALAKSDEAFDAALDHAREWRKLIGARPPLYPLRDDRDERKFKKALDAFLHEHPTGPFADEARALLLSGEQRAAEAKASR